MNIKPNILDNKRIYTELKNITMNVKTSLIPLETK